ncbi:MAG: pirin-like C-terminal cupin domain-containing protein [Acidimicrobiales bacterium]
MDPAARPRARGRAHGVPVRGASLRLGGHEIEGSTAAVVRCDEPVAVVAGATEVDVLVLQGVPIAEPVAQYGPFVMNERAEIEQAFVDYRRTGFGGWPWSSDDPVHGPDPTRFARHADGRVERVV